MPRLFNRTNQNSISSAQDEDRILTHQEIADMVTNLRASNRFNKKALAIGIPLFLISVGLEVFFALQTKKYSDSRDDEKFTTFLILSLINAAFISISLAAGLCVPGVETWLNNRLLNRCDEAMQSLRATAEDTSFDSYFARQAAEAGEQTHLISHEEPNAIARLN